MHVIKASSNMADKNKTKKELMTELEELRLQLKHFELSSGHKTDIPDETFHLIVESVPNGIVMTDNLGKIIFLNSQAEKMFGYERSALFGESVEMLIPKDLRKSHIHYRADYMKTPDTRAMGEGRDLFALRSDGSKFPVEVGLNFVKSDTGLIVISTIIDITERKYAESRLQEERERAQNYLDIAEVILLAINRDGDVTLINRKGCDILGCSEEEILGKNWFDNFVPSNTRKKIKDIFHKIISEEPKKLEFHENCVIAKSSKLKTILWHNTVLTDNEGSVVGTLSSGVDITERKATERLLRSREESLREIMDNTTDAIIVFDNQGFVETLNREGQKLFGGNSTEKIDRVWEIITPENKESFLDKLNKVREGKRITDYETERMDKDGKRISVSISLVYMSEGQGRFIETIRDISERLIMRNKIIDLEKAQIIGKMAEGFAHHMGTPLASMLLRVQMLKDDLPDLPEWGNVGEKLDSIERQILYGQKVIQRLLRFVRRPDNEKISENISMLLEESIEMIRPLVKKKGIHLETDLDDSIELFADINLIHLVFSDTMMNSLDAMPEGGVLTIISSKNEADNCINIKIKDTGIGISEDIIPFVFEPFFSTKPTGKGTGLGLSMAKSIVNEHGGNINIESQQGTGTVVSISFPVINKEENL